MEIKYKGKPIHPYESFYHDASERFNHGEIGGVFHGQLKLQVV